MLRFLLRLFGALGLLGGRRSGIRHILVRGHPQAAALAGDALGMAHENVVAVFHAILLSVPGRSVWCGRSC